MTKTLVRVAVEQIAWGKTYEIVAGGNKGRGGKKLACYNVTSDDLEYLKT